MMRLLAALLLLPLLTSCLATAVVGTAVGVTSAVVGATVKTTGAVIGAAIPGDDDDEEDEDEDD
jgi:hypothetical protein